MPYRATAVLLAGVLLAGCITSRSGMHEIPVTRDYAKLAKQDLDESAASVAKARRAGAAHSAPYEFYSAENYLAMARRQRLEGDRRGTWDYAALAIRMAEEAMAIAEDKAIEAAGSAPEPPATRQAAQDLLKTLQDRCLDVDRDKALEIAPILYAHMTAALSRAEHHLNGRRHWRRAIDELQAVQAYCDTLETQDSDDDGIPDIEDAAPAAAEDLDAFEDEDGAPDLDNDEDGVPDEQDVAPNEPETLNRWRDYDGAPDAYPSLPPVLFSKGKANLSGEAQGYLRGMSLLMANVPDLKLRIRGHATEEATSLENLDLSRRRVQQVLQLLLTHGTPKDQMVVTYHGDTEPLPGTEPGQDDAANRRVELIVE